MSERKPLPGKFIWYELVSRDAKKAQTFYAEVLGWDVRPFPMGNFDYEMIYAGGTMIGGYAAPQHKAHWPGAVEKGRPAAHWISCVSVEDVDASAKAATANGGKVVEPPFDTPGVGRMARIADPQGAELYVMKNAQGDVPDATASPGCFFWNELHTSQPAQALSFYAKVVGFSHRSFDAAGTYHVVSRGGVDRGGVTGHLPSGTSPHWLPYVVVEDVDATAAHAQRLGGKILMDPQDIPGVGRIGVLQDPTGAELAIMKPLPM